MLIRSGSIAYELIEFGVLALIGVILYYKWSFGYWKRKGLPYLEPSMPFGNISELLLAKLSFGEQFEKIYNAIRKRGERHAGIYLINRPAYIPADPEILKDMMVKNFNSFIDRGFFINEDIDPLSGHLFLLEGDKWKNLRAKLTSTFTSGKMKMMFQTMAACADELTVLVNKAGTTKDDMDIKETMARFTTDVISSCAFGIESNSLKHAETDFRHYGRRIIENTLWENLKNIVQFAFPRSLLSRIHFKVSKPDVEHFIMDVVKKNVNHREQNNVSRNDFFQLLLEIKNNDLNAPDGKSKMGMTVNELAAQVFVFFLAGFETSSSTITWTLYELTKNPEIQDTLRQEVKTVLAKHNNQISYESIMEMTYMDKVISETLRKYPPLPFLNRQSTATYTIPGTDITLEKGTPVVIPILGLQHDPEYYPNPDQYDPERFSEENKRNRPAFTWLAFGEGPRICIGMRFGLLQVKIGLTTVLRDHLVSLSPKTVNPTLMDKKTLATSSKNGIYLKLSKA